MGCSATLGPLQPTVDKRYRTVLSLWLTVTRATVLLSFSPCISLTLFSFGWENSVWTCLSPEKERRCFTTCLWTLRGAARFKPLSTGANIVYHTPPVWGNLAQRLRVRRAFIMKEATNIRHPPLSSDVSLSARSGATSLVALLLRTAWIECSCIELDTGQRRQWCCNLLSLQVEWGCSTTYTWSIT